jgi:single-strand DNA-binding protein
MLNTCVLTGNLGADPDCHFSADGSQIASFNLAFRCSKKKTGWIKITTFQKLAVIVEKHLHKGARIAVTGIIDHHKWAADDGSPRSAIQMIANNIEFIKTDGRGFAEGENHEDGTPF